MNVGDWIRKWSLIQPNKNALFYEDQPITYRELNQRINQLYYLLLDIRIQKGDRIAVLLYNCHQYLEIFFALSKLGAILVPLNWRLAVPELEFIIKDSGSRLLIFEPEFEEVVHSLRSRLPFPDGNILTVGSPCPGWSMEYEKAISKKATHEPPVNGSAGGEDPHIIMYTSGTTGVPKGAVLSHRKTLFNVLNADMVYHLTPTDVIITCRPLFHSGGLLVQSAPVLYKGGSLVLKKRSRPQEILETIGKYRVTILELAPTVFQNILRDCDPGQYDLSSLRCFFTGGERISIAMLKEYHRRGINLSQIFGQTETSTITFLPPEDAGRKVGSVGLPIFHGDVKIVDKEGRDVKAGEVGEIIINGPTLMSGYWNRPDLTAETIREGWLHTGDLARVDEEGYFYVVDREKDVYISGGENVYPAEIEKLFFIHPKVFDVAIVGVPDEKWGEVGKTYIVLKPGETMTQEEALEFLQGKVGKYKIPKYVEFVKELPKTASGKIQKFLLKERHRDKTDG
jgi:fatty-acyl-CoA synthase